MDRDGVPSVAGEFARAQLGDARLVQRLQVSAARLSASPDLGFPRAHKTESESEGFYRLLSNDRVHYDALVRAHALETRDRIGEGEVFRVIHDTTEFTFDGEVEREGLGRTRSAAAQGFFAHVALAVSCDEVRRPLGVIGAHCWARTKPARGNRKLSAKQLIKDPDRESTRWGKLVDDVEQRIDGRGRAIHLMDREGDNYALFSRMLELNASFVIRMAKDRFVQNDTAAKVMLSEALLDLPRFTVREVPLSRRVVKAQPRSNKTHPPRASRTAKLALRAGVVTLTRPKHLDSACSETLKLNVVYVEEIDVPPDTDPVTWVLLTSEPIATASDVEAVVDHYRARWLIEEFFKALKTGCRFEERQLESFQSLTNALAIFFPIAWQMLLLRAVSRAEPDAPAETVLTATQIKILQEHQPGKMPRTGATVRHALYAVAGMGGHLKRNGAPGWRTLSYGMQELLKYEAIWDTAFRIGMKTAKKCDQ